jgi:ParB/RepB/Spo0J family partition protein
MTTIPLSQLTPAKANVRKTGGNDAIEELAASIAAHGLLTSLAVRKSTRGKYTVVAGQRRYHALRMLADRDQIPANLPVLCQVIDRDADATEIGLAEDVVRLAMHPADQFEAFRALVDKGSDVAAIAARFGVPETTVARRLTRLIHRISRCGPIVQRQRSLTCFTAGGLIRILLSICEASGVDQQGFRRGIRPAAHVGRSASVPTKLRNSSASGQLAANASLTRLAVSLIRTAIFNSRSRMVENSPLASGCGLGMASRTVSISQYAAEWRIRRI